MNLDRDPTVGQLRDLIQQGDDRAGHHVVWVKKNGEVVLSRIPKGQKPIWAEQEHPDMQMCTEVFRIGNEYVGPEAAADNEWVTELFNRLLLEWPQAKQGTEVVHLDTTSGVVD